MLGLLLALACVPAPRLTTNCRQLVAEEDVDCGSSVFVNETACEASGCSESDIDDILEWAWCKNDLCVGDTASAPCDFPDVAASCDAAEP
jgi:hypothetical protein